MFDFSNCVVCLTLGNVEDVYWYAQTLYLTGQYHRAAHCILNQKLHTVSETVNLKTSSTK